MAGSPWKSKWSSCEMERAPPQGAFGSGPMPTWLPPPFEGWSSPLSEDQGLVVRDGRGVDDQLGGHGSGRQRRARSFEEKSGRTGRASGSCSKSRGGDTRWIFKRRRSKEEKEEVRKEEEEGEGEGSREQTLVGFVREDGIGPRPNSAKEALEAGKEGRKKEESQVELFRQQFNQLRGVEHWGGRDLRNFRPRGASDGSVEQDPRLLDTSHSRPHAEGISAADWSALESRPGVTTSSIQSVLEECAGLELRGRCREKCRHFRMCWICCSRREQRQHATWRPRGWSLWNRPPQEETSISQRQELVPAEMASMSSTVETLEASRL